MVVVKEEVAVGVIGLVVVVLVVLVVVLVVLVVLIVVVVLVVVVLVLVLVVVVGLVVVVVLVLVLVLLVVVVVKGKKKGKEKKQKQKNAGNYISILIQPCARPCAFLRLPWKNHVFLPYRITKVTPPLNLLQGGLERPPCGFQLCMRQQCSHTAQYGIDSRYQGLLSLNIL